MTKRLEAPSTEGNKKKPVNHCRFGKVWHSWQRGYVNCQMRVKNGGYCHHHMKPWT